MDKWKSYLLLPRILTIYMLAALLWWSYLLFDKNKEITEGKLELLQLKANIENSSNNYDLQSLPEYTEILKKHKRQQYMIIGEGLVFAITLMLGITLINKAHHRQLENQRRQNNFLLSVTHELRSPLASIMLILGTLKKRILPQEKITELSEDAIQEGERLEKQINNILLAAKLDKSYSLDKTQIDIVESTKKILAKFQKKYTSVQFSYSAPNQLILKIDEDAYHSMVSNLIENGIKYGPKQEITKIKVRIEEEEEVTIAVEDNGIGIPDDEKKNVVKQFYRIGNEETRNSKGTGLGLYIVERLVHNHHGYLSIQNNKPKGTIITIHLPPS